MILHDEAGADVLEIPRRREAVGNEHGADYARRTVRSAIKDRTKSSAVSGDELTPHVGGTKQSKRKESHVGRNDCRCRFPLSWTVLAPFDVRVVHFEQTPSAMRGRICRPDRLSKTTARKGLPVEYRGIRYTVRARIERNEWTVSIHPAGIEGAKRVVIGPRERMDLLARSMIDRWYERAPRA